MLKSIFEKMSSPKWLISVATASLIIGVLANFLTRFIEKGFLRSIAAFKRLREKAKEREAEIEDAKLKTALEISEDPKGQLLALFISLRSEVRTILWGIAPLFLSIVTLSYIQDKRIAALIFVPFSIMSIIGLKLESKKAISWAQILGKSIELSK